MKKILIPVDLTEISGNTIQYALKSFPDANFVILHVDAKSLSKKELHKHRTSFKKPVLQALGTQVIPQNITIEMINGFAVNAVSEFSKEGGFDFPCL